MKILPAAILSYKVFMSRSVEFCAIDVIKFELEPCHNLLVIFRTESRRLLTEYAYSMCRISYQCTLFPCGYCDVLCCMYCTVGMMCMMIKL